MARQSSPIEDALAVRLYEAAQAAEWGLTIDHFRDALDGSLAHAFPNRRPTVDERDRYLAALHVDDLALASACAAGNEAAWNHFVLTYRPALYRAADAIDPSGRARDLADVLYADLFGLKERDGVRQSLFRYFHGRSRLSTWLRAVLSQRHVDRLRSERAHDPLPEEDAAAPGQLTARQANPDQPRFLAVMGDALQAAIQGLEPRDRLRLRCYYTQDMTLAAIGRLHAEHEGTVSRHLTRTRRAIREKVEAQLRSEHGFDSTTIAECFNAVVDDAGSMDLARMIGTDDGRKDGGPDRSN